MSVGVMVGYVLSFVFLLGGIVYALMGGRRI
ncbi:MAG: hypothetical protein PWQ16_1305 [bacterium]|nr:hypothetical protein [bacterium]